MRLLELFSGTKWVGRAFEALGWEVTSLDADATTRPTICADVQAWDYGTYPPGHFDLIWASPVCTGAALRRRVLLQVRLPLPEDHPHLEQPALGSSQPVCSKRSRCEAFQDGRHPETAQRQGSRHWPGQTREQLYSLPPRLCQEIARGEPKWER